MGEDYTLYNEHYNYMNQTLQYIQSLSKYMPGGYYQQRVSEPSEFYKTFQDSSSKLKAPESMEAIFREAAEQYDVPVSLLKAIGKAESGFDANAVSSAGAQGVMQLMPATAKGLGVTDPFDARSNIMGGAKYIADKLRQYNGDIELALAAYNAGSGNVAKYGGVPPFKETQNYIRKVKGYMNEDITVDKTVYSGNSSQERSYAVDGDTDRGIQMAFTAENALYYIEMMKLQMQSRMALASKSLLYGEEV